MPDDKWYIWKEWKFYRKRWQIEMDKMSIYKI
jgi:hypothetical protein